MRNLSLSAQDNQDERSLFQWWYTIQTCLAEMQ